MLQSESWRIMFTKSEIQKESEWMTKARVYLIILTIEHEKGHLLFFFQGIALTRFGKFTDIVVKTRVISKKKKKKTAAAVRSDYGARNFLKKRKKMRSKMKHSKGL